MQAMSPVGSVSQTETLPTDAEWAPIEALLPSAKKLGRPGTTALHDGAAIFGGRRLAGASRPRPAAKLGWA
jgi:transposase